MIKPIRAILNTKRKNKRLISIGYDIFAIAMSIYLAIALRLGTYTFELGLDEWVTLLLTISVTVFTFAKLGMYRAVLRYMMFPAVGNIFLAVFISSLTLVMSGFFFHTFIPRSVPFIYAGLAILTLGGPRIMIRSAYDQMIKRKKPNVFIYGAGATGRELAYALIHGDEYNPVILLDDDPSKRGNILFGLKVHHPSEFEHLQSLYQPVKLLLAINNINKGKRLRLVEKLSDWPIAIQSVPSVEDIAAGKATATEIKDLDVADLLGRAPITPDSELLAKNIHDKSVMVTGAGGSIGSELCRQILAQQPKILVLFELNEYNLYKIEQELLSTKKNLKSQTQIIAALGSVQRQNRLEKLINTYEVETLYHAAAYKHVPLVEDNVVEGIRNNVFGTLSCAQAAIECGVKNFTLISTDKAVRPTNVMGASKRMAELVLQALADKGTDTVFTMVRFGNVLGSSGSVVPLFKKQIKAGGPVTVTHPDIIRYFMLIPEAAQLVIQAGAMSNNGQVFVLDMGEPVKILDLAKRMVHLMGMKESLGSNSDEGDIEIKFTGLRPGEKLYEELLIGDNVEGTSHQKIMTAMESKLSWPEMQILLNELDECCHDFNVDCIRRILLEAPTGYTPNDNT
ncbi:MULTISPECIES: nucleoside-diphosphate sugar epimerase/dehydratase [unclassified Vibrio]|uniref:nucleoside-diphosphate sugar epimerase/dehydratase n=1 Tax=unclassified Vibrio TaxID=2614977 RepID=UPI000C867905|nr:MULTISPECIES: nucleoside-diphosphate sugar epimerase/dehydratase [unclassified Vibrio]PMK18680.1 nucleoside-diphosphate sugar epimerase [Vibrio sp. 10N.261.54.C3]PMN96572.1 nucleoside-diphosphate sugar epimerase [Vibrio sp. 10N.222.55.C12]PMO17511.1 nucleoside-diphosphate sugar epimerase [Vibrio sp. 10N.222.54.B6]TKF38423.1 polysaccharide biosynthesis protein [Vibrio sp. F13]TKF64176.1 polysaccharide biosynthesis protein [Vibrio sp. F13]